MHLKRNSIPANKQDARQLPLPTSESWEQFPTPAATYERVTGNKWADLPTRTQEQFAFLPPDADESDIAFVLLDPHRNSPEA